jgi:hypothetical protein
LPEGCHTLPSAQPGKSAPTKLKTTKEFRSSFTMFYPLVKHYMGSNSLCVMFRFSGGKEHVELPNGKSEHLSEMLDDVPISSHGTTELVF